MDNNLPVIKQDLFLGANFKETMEIAEFFAKSDLLPKHFQNKPANVFIGLELAARMDISPFMLFQSLYLVYGRPGIEAKLAIALAKKNGWNIEYKVEMSGNKTIACTCVLERSGVKVVGPRIDWDLVQAEGWDKKDGSKWKTSPDLMFRYRAASWAIRLTCPEVLMGVTTAEELEDIEPLSITTAPIPEAPAPEDSGPTKPSFDTLWADYPGPNKEWLQGYLEAFAKHNKIAVEAAKMMAVDKWEQFIETFEKWSAKQAKKSEKEAAQAPPPSEPPPVNGNVQAEAEKPATGNLTGPKIVNPGTPEQIEWVEVWMKQNDYPPEAMLSDNKGIPLNELDYDTIAELIKKLKP